MKKMILTLILFLTFLRCIAPIAPPIAYIPAPPIIAIYGLTDPLAHSVAYYESRFKEKIVNKVSGARGLMQITKVMVREVNRIQSRYEMMFSHFGLFVKLPRYTWNDAFDPYKSIEMWYVFQGYHNPTYNPERACKLWFGSGVQYDGMRWPEYYSDVKQLINKIYD